MVAQDVTRECLEVDTDLVCTPCKKFTGDQLVFLIFGEGQMSEKRLSYRLESRKTAPGGYSGGNAGRYSERSWSSRGGRGGGGCWN